MPTSSKNSSSPSRSKTKKKDKHVKIHVKKRKTEVLNQVVPASHGNANSNNGTCHQNHPNNTKYMIVLPAIPIRVPIRIPIPQSSLWHSPSHSHE